jgi:tetraacyldisaccharide 4'-kinase
LAGVRVLAFAGIGRPAKFFATLAEAGALVVGQQAFADHHPFRPAELRELARRAEALQARLVTTPKDAVRLPPDWRQEVVVAGVRLDWEDEGDIEALLTEL